MIIEPVTSTQIHILQTPPNPDWDEGIRKPMIDIDEYHRRWKIRVGLYRITIAENGDLLLINGKEWKGEKK